MTSMFVAAGELCAGDIVHLSSHVSYRVDAFANQGIVGRGSVGYWATYVRNAHAPQLVGTTAPQLIVHRARTILRVERRSNEP